jgi:hypothetical protein
MMWRRRLFTFGSIVSLLLWVAVCALWARSHVVRDYAWAWLPWPGADGRSIKVDADSGGGQVEIAWHVWTAAERAAVQRNNALAGVNWYHRTFPDVPRQYARSIPPTAWNAAGFKWYRGPTHASVSAPYWSAALLSAVLPVAWVATRWRRRWRLVAGRCPACGYDLRASPHRCPECGTPAAHIPGSTPA